VGPQAAAAAVLFGEILNGEEAARVGLAYRYYEDDELLAAAQTMAARAASAPRELIAVTKVTIGEMAGVATHAEAVEHELVPQLWSTQQQFFRDRIAALQAKISSKK
jgi:enoyl-CoA hydratase